MHEPSYKRRYFLAAFDQYQKGEIGCVVHLTPMVPEIYTGWLSEH